MKKIAIIVIAILTAALSFTAGYLFRQQEKTPAEKKNGQDETSWQEEFNLSSRNLVPTGRNQYFILEPGFYIVLEGRNEKVVITVLDETVEITRVITRVVEEREWINNDLVEVSRNFFAIDTETRDVFYFGEDVDDYSNGIIFAHGGAWRAGQGNARAGMMMPGQPTLNQKYYQEIAPKVAMDRAEVVSLRETLTTPAGDFKNLLKTLETTALNPLERDYKTYAPDIGIIQDEYLLLTEYGFIQE